MKPTKDGVEDEVTLPEVVSPNDLKFHRFDEVYNKVVSNLATATCERQALGDILDRWIGGIEDKLVSLGIDEESEEFDAQVATRISEDLASLTNGKVPADFVRVVQTIFTLKQEGDLGGANALISWLAGSRNIDAGAKRRAGIKGEVSSRDAMDYLRGVVEIVHAAGYKGMLIVIDEAETILRQRSDSRHKSLKWHSSDRRRGWILSAALVVVYRDSGFLRLAQRRGWARALA